MRHLSDIPTRLLRFWVNRGFTCRRDVTLALRGHEAAMGLKLDAYRPSVSDLTPFTEEIKRRKGS